MQLVAYGAQDIYLTGNPQITFFKVVYRRHTNFAVESIEQTFNGASSLGQKFSCTISRNGDLLSRVYLEMDLKDNGTVMAATVNAGFDLIKYAEIEIGGQCIDKHYGEWMSIWTHLSHDSDKLDMLKEMIDVPTGLSAGDDQKLYVPLQFWFCRNPGLALPLIALQYHEVKLNVQFVTATPVTNLASFNTCVFCDYIFLDTDERRRFAQVSHEYLIEQVQFSNALSGPELAVVAANAAGTIKATGQAELRFNHPVKELLWVMEQTSDFKTTRVDASGTALSADEIQNHQLDEVLLQLNGHDRFRKRAGSYFTHVQRYEHHSGADTNTSADKVGDRVKNVHMYSFALKPEEHQPSGTCNFSRIDNAVLSYTVSNRLAGTGITTGTATDTNTLKVYAVNYNVLRIMSGMGGLAYSN